MCNFHQDGSNCKFENRMQAFSKQLIYDSNGYCLFHSEDIAWKHESGFAQSLKEFVQLQIEDSAMRAIDLSEAILDESVNEVFQLDTGNKKLDFDHCRILSDIVLDGSEINGTLSFKHTTIAGKVSLKNAMLDGVNLSSSSSAIPSSVS